MKNSGVNRHSINPSDPSGTRYIVTSQHGSSVPASQQTFQMMHQSLGMQPSPYLPAGHSVRDVLQPTHIMGPLLTSHPLLQQFQQHQQQQHIVDPMPPRRPQGAMRVSLLRDIGKAGERDRAETSMPSSHGYMPFPSGHERSAIGISNIPSHSTLLSDATRQTGSLTPPHHLQMHRQSVNHSPLMQGTMPTHFSVQQSAFMQTADKRKPQQVKTSETGVTYIKDDVPSSSSITQLHLPQNTPHSITTYQPSAAPKLEEKKPNINHLKEDLVQTMEKFDRDMLKINNEIERLERKKQQLEEVAKKPREPEKEAVPPKKAISKHQELWQVIYAENKKKAESAKDALKGMGRWYEMPLYNQPCDTKVYQDNIKKNEEMRPKLLAYFQRRATLHNIRDNYLSSRYDELMDDWQKRISKIENNPKRKAKDAKVRDFFEKQFPEIKKQREQQDRFQRGNRGDSCRSDADFAEIVDGLTEQENHEQSMRQLAVVPPILLDKEERRVRFINTNGLIKDAFKDYKQQQQLDNWSDVEKEVFKEKYILHPKNFNLIASCLEKKSVQDCVLFYYLTKKKVNYKSLSRKNTLKPRKPKSTRGQSNNDAKSDKDDKKDCDGTMKDETDERIDRPPSPRVTRSRNKNLNWTDEDIVLAKEGFSKHGKDYATISKLFQNKSEHQVKNFYNNYKKKHNLDQLINNSQDGKRRKEGRRGRTTNVSESATEQESAVTEDESSKDSNDAAVANKKQRKENTESPLTLQEDVVVLSEKSEVTSSAEATMANTTLTIRTRSAAATDVKSSESGKRPPESQTIDAPAEKRSKKSRVSTPTKKDEKTETKKEGKPKAAKSLADVKDNKTDAPDATLLTEDEPKQISSATSTSIEVKKSTSVTQPTDVVQPTSGIVETSTTISDDKQKRDAPFKESLKTSTPVSIAPAAPKPSSSSNQTSLEEKRKESAPALVSTTAETKTSWIQKDSKIVTKQISVVPTTLSKPPPVPMDMMPVTMETRKDEDDSSATCSADEESANMSDFNDSNKPPHKQHSESPYAFEDNTTSQIRLETKPKLTIKTTEMDINRPVTVTSDISKTHAGNLRTIAPTWIPPTEHSRPQSVPTAPPMQRPTLPLPTVPQSKTVHTQSPATRPSSTPMFAVQDMRFPGTQNITRPVVISKATKPSQVIASPLSTTHVVDAIRKNEADSRSMSSSFPPAYHQVPATAMSMQKDFNPNAMKAKEHTDPLLGGPKNYTSTDKAVMRERAAVIPVGKLKYPPSSDSFRRPEPSISSAMQAHMIPQTVFSLAGVPQHVIQTEARGVSIMQGKPITTLATITTSAIPTKFVTAALQTVSKQSLDIPMNLSRTSNVMKSQSSIPQELYSQRPRSGSDAGKYSVAGRGSIVQGIPIASESRKLKTSQSSIDIAQQRQQYKSKNIIPGREIIVQAPKPSVITGSGEKPEDKSKISPAQMHYMNPFQQTMTSVSKSDKPKHTASILQGTPIPRKLSDESLSMSPIRNQSPFAGRSSPAQVIKPDSRHVNQPSPHIDIPRQAMVSPYAAQLAQQQSLWAAAAAEGGRQSAELQAIRQAIKQEVSSPSIHAASQPRLPVPSMNPRQQNPTAIPLDHLFRMQPALAAAMGKDMDMSNLMRQYGAMPAVPTLAAGIPPGILPYRMSMVHPSTTDNSLNTVLSQDYQTARLMDKTLAAAAASGSTTPSPAIMASLPASAISRMPAYLTDYRLIQQSIARGIYPPPGLIGSPQPQQQLHRTSPHRASQSPNSSAFMGSSPDIMMARNRSSEDLSNWSKNQLGRSPGRASSSPRNDNGQQEKYLQQQRHIGQGRQPHSPIARSLEQSPHREFTPPINKNEQQKLVDRHNMYLINQAQQQRAEASKKESSRLTPDYHYRSNSYDRSRMFEQQRMQSSPSFTPDRSSSPRVISDKQQQQQHMEAKEAKIAENYSKAITPGKERSTPTQATQHQVPSHQRPQVNKPAQQQYRDISKARGTTTQMISQQTEELKNKGQTRMKAEHLIEAIIINQMDRSNKNEEDSKDKHKQSDRSSTSSPSQSVTLPMPAIHPMMIMNSMTLGPLQIPQPSGMDTKNQPSSDKQKMMMMEPQMRNLEQKSRKIINEMYSSPSQLSRPGSANSIKDKSPTYKTEPISPPSHKKVVPTTLEQKQQQQQVASLVQQHQQQQQQHAAMNQMMRFQIPHHINPATPSIKTMEDIIIDALIGSSAQESDVKSRSTPISVISTMPHGTSEAARDAAAISQQQQNYMMSALFVKKDPTGSPSQATPQQPVVRPGLPFQHVAPPMTQPRPPVAYHQQQEVVQKAQPPPQVRQAAPPRQYQPAYQPPKQQMYEEISDEDD